LIDTYQVMLLWCWLVNQVGRHCKA